MSDQVITISEVRGGSPPGVVRVPRFMAYDEGCYECGEPSGIIGFYSSEAEATEAAGLAEDLQQADWHGQHSMFVIDLLNPSWSKYGPNGGKS